MSAPTRLTLYRALRRVAGPVLAYRLAFTWGPVKTGYPDHPKQPQA